MPAPITSTFVFMSAESRACGTPRSCGESHMLCPVRRSLGFVIMSLTEGNNPCEGKFNLPLRGDRLDGGFDLALSALAFDCTTPGRTARRMINAPRCLLGVS